MNKPKLNFAVDFLLFLAFVVAAGTGIILEFLHGGGPGSGTAELLGIQRSGWKEIHEISGKLMILLALVHLILHWRWIVCTAKNLFGPEECKNEPKESDA
jgi:hypothetical protein